MRWGTASRPAAWPTSPSAASGTPAATAPTRSPASSPSTGSSARSSATVASSRRRSPRSTWIRAGWSWPTPVTPAAHLAARPCRDVHPDRAGRPAGLGTEPTTTIVQLARGDAVLFCTDGIAESRSPRGEFFGDDRLAALLTALAAEAIPPAEIAPLPPRRRRPPAGPTEQRRDAAPAPMVRRGAARHGGLRRSRPDEPVGSRGLATPVRCHGLAAGRSRALQRGCVAHRVAITVIVEK